MSSSLVLANVTNRLAVLTLNQPEKRNALSRPLLEELGARLTEIGADPGIHVVILGAAGPVFSSGHDLRELVGKKEEEYTSLFAL